MDMKNFLPKHSYWLLLAGYAFVLLVGCTRKNADELITKNPINPKLGESSMPTKPFQQMSKNELGNWIQQEADKRLREGLVLFPNMEEAYNPIAKPNSKDAEANAMAFGVQVQIDFLQLCYNSSIADEQIVSRAEELLKQCQYYTPSRQFEQEICALVLTRFSKRDNIEKALIPPTQKYLDILITRGYRDVLPLLKTYNLIQAELPQAQSEALKKSIRKLHEKQLGLSSQKLASSKQRLDKSGDDASPGAKIEYSREGYLYNRLLEAKQQLQ